jgi:WD40 repeat protein
MKGHRGCVDSVTATSDGTHVVSGGDDGMVRIWDAVAGSAAAEPSEYDGVKIGFGGSECRRVAYIFGGSEGLVRVWDAASGTVVSHAWKDHNHSVPAIAVGANGTLVVSYGRHGWGPEFGWQR